MELPGDLRSAIEEAARDGTATFEGLAPIDVRRVVRRIDQSHSTISVENYRGSRTTIEALKLIEQNASTKALQAAIQQLMPALFGYVYCEHFGLRWHAGDAQSLIVHWAHHLSAAARAGKEPVAALDGLIQDLGSIISGRAALVTRAPLAGLRLPDGVQRIQLDDDTVLRTLTSEETEEIGASDVISGMQAHDILSRSINTVLEQSVEVSCELRPATGDILRPTSHVHRDRFEATLKTLMRTLHLVTAGRAAMVFTESELRPSVLPGMKSGRTMPLVATPFENLELSEDACSSLRQTFDAVATHPRSEFHIAIDRLLDAEHRVSRADALLDCATALEALLNPRDSGEASFRVALNYAFLFPPPLRRSKYAAIREMHLARNRLVHSGHSPQNVSRAKQAAGAAIAALREVLHLFITDPRLNSTIRLDADFWLDRIIPDA